MSSSSPVNYIAKLIQGLRIQNIDFILSENALGCLITEVYITEAHELIMFPDDQLDTIALQWVLQVRTPLKVRIIIFSAEASKLKTQLANAINKLRLEGLEISQTEHAISIQELTEENIQLLLNSLEKRINIISNESQSPQIQNPAIPSIKPSKKNYSSSNQIQGDLYTHLRNAIKTYWTERYFARYMNFPSEKVKDLAEQIGIQHEVCGKDVLYFFDRKKALETYYKHIIKGMLDELNLKYRETSQHDFFLPELNLTLRFFNDEIEQLERVGVGAVKNRNLIIIAPKALQRNIEQIPDAFFQVLPLDQDKIKAVLIRAIRRRVDYLPAYSSGIVN